MNELQEKTKEVFKKYKNIKFISIQDKDPIFTQSLFITYSLDKYLFFRLCINLIDIKESMSYEELLEKQIKMQIANYVLETN